MQFDTHTSPIPMWEVCVSNYKHKYFTIYSWSSTFAPVYTFSSVKTCLLAAPELRNHHFSDPVTDPFHLLSPQPAICFGSTTCPNGGTCTSPDHCSGCDEGYSSPRCDREYDRDGPSPDGLCTSLFLFRIMMAAKTR